MSDEVKVGTCGFDHVGLSVRDLAISRKFFCDCLGWRVVGERPDYPAAFVSEGHCVLTLWEVASPDMAIAFDRRANVGLHRLALAVADRAGLDALYQRVSAGPTLSSSLRRNCPAPVLRSISWCTSRAACGSSLPSMLASKAYARRGSAV